jgi:hypothetical protein
MPRQGKKKQKRLEARLKEWSAMKDGADDKNKKSSYGGHYHKKPGSLK